VAARRHIRGLRGWAGLLQPWEGQQRCVTTPPPAGTDASIPSWPAPSTVGGKGARIAASAWAARHLGVSLGA
jgi:hypothetical protein